MAQANKIQRGLYAELEGLSVNLVGEIINGTLHTHPRPARGHGRTATALSSEVYSRFSRAPGGPGGWVFINEQELHHGTQVVVPDISGWKIERYPSHEVTPFSTVAPDWVCEVMSPSTRTYDRLTKLKIYAEFGVPHCWYVDSTAQTLEVFILANGSYLVGPAFTGADPVVAPPFASHTFDLGLLWDTPRQQADQG